MIAPKVVFGRLCESRRNNFDFLRFALATLVIASHARMTAVLDTGDREVRFLGPGRLAVDGFFVISGFLIARSWLQGRGPGDFARKRFRRIYPGLVAALVFCVVVVGPLGGADLGTYFLDPQTYRFFAPLLFQANQTLPGVFVNLPHAHEVNGPVWTIRYEIACYAAVALLGILGLLRRTAIMLTLFSVSLAIFTAQVSGWPTPWGVSVLYFGVIDHLPRLMTFFLAGAVFHAYRNSIPFSFAWFSISMAVLLLTFRIIPSVTVPIFGSYALFYVAFFPTRRLHGFARNGDFSYGLYLYAWPVQQLLIYYFGASLVLGHGLDRLALFGLTFGLTLPLAILSWHVIEKPFLTRVTPGPTGVPRTTPAPAGVAALRHAIRMAREPRSLSKNFPPGDPDA